MSHTAECATVTDPDSWRRCTCCEPDTDWAPNEPCGGIATSANGGPYSEPPLCEAHMKPWGHRRPTPAADQPTTAPNEHAEHARAAMAKETT